MWGNQQQVAIQKVSDWLRNRNSPWFTLGGWAGTGKTTLAKHLAASVSGTVYFAAYTGKAAHVLMQSGCENVSTIHKLIYKPKDKSQTKLKELMVELTELRRKDPLPTNLITRVEAAIEMEKRNLSRPAFQLNSDSPLLDANVRLLIIDEYSMVDEQMGSDLLSFNVPILCLGDPGQLPPVGGRPFWGGKPNYMLTEIHRQAKDNPIIELATIVREGGRLSPGTYGNSQVIPYNAVPRDSIGQWVLDADQLLVGKNATRTSSNKRVRQLHGRESTYPVTGDKLVCLRNNHQLGLLNGQMWTAASDAVEAEGSLAMTVVSEDTKLEVIAHADYFNGETPDHWSIKDAESFDYGYALTVHKSQGSQWQSVILFDEWYRDDRAKWLYTAITRASERIVIVQM